MPRLTIIPVINPVIKLHGRGRAVKPKDEAKIMPRQPIIIRINPQNDFFLKFISIPHYLFYYQSDEKTF